MRAVCVWIHKERLLGFRINGKFFELFEPTAEDNPAEPARPGPQQAQLANGLVVNPSVDDSVVVEAVDWSLGERRSACTCCRDCPLNARCGEQVDDGDAIVDCANTGAGVARSEALGFADRNGEGTRLVVVGEVLLRVEAIEVCQTARHR